MTGQRFETIIFKGSVEGMVGRWLCIYLLNTVFVSLSNCKLVSRVHLVYMVDICKANRFDQQQ